MSAANAIANRRGAVRFSPQRLASALVLALVLLTAGVVSAAPAENSPITPVAMITFDDDGKNLHYPSAIFFDTAEEELYLVNGGSSRIIVYGPDSFPRVSIGRGRGVEAPRGVFVTQKGEVYVCQSRSALTPNPRITVLNGAFFVEREITLDGIPETANFSPSKLAVSSDGLIYVAGESSRGVLVLDSE
ncbi:MAG: hypothetical protein IH614_16070, partial [Desulfuromonadales bacterium]|nr:hypothetical protein [Desulfuromonadales bacterium]